MSTHVKLLCGGTVAVAALAALTAPKPQVDFDSQGLVRISNHGLRTLEVMNIPQFHYERHGYPLGPGKSVLDKWHNDNGDGMYRLYYRQLPVPLLRLRVFHITTNGS